MGTYAGNRKAIYFVPHSPWKLKMYEKHIFIYVLLISDVTIFSIFSGCTVNATCFFHIFPLSSNIKCFLFCNKEISTLLYHHLRVSLKFNSHAVVIFRFAAKSVPRKIIQQHLNDAVENRCFRSVR